MPEPSAKSRSLIINASVRESFLDRLPAERLDILVIGGGITGAGIIRDAALRGYRAALIEKADFSAGTSSKSSKLVHGGFRYLMNLEFGLVREALIERKTLMEIAPHLVRPIPCLLPIYKDHSGSPLIIHIGLFLYDWLAASKGIGRHRMISSRQSRILEPALRQANLQKLAQYYDCQADDFRLVMATLQSAVENGAMIVNYVKAVDILMNEGQISGILARDELSGKIQPIHSRVIINATGPWCDELRRILLDERNPYVRPTKGVHLIVYRNDLPLKHAIIVPAIQDQRPVFAIPWKKFVLLGTTDTDYHDDPDFIPIKRSDVDYLLETFNHYFPEAKLSYDHVISTFAGLRPLTRETGKSASAVTREYHIYEQPDNFFSIIGGKLTTYRTMAKEMIDRVARRLETSFGIAAANPRCRTHTVPLYGGNIDNFENFSREWKAALTTEHGFSKEIVEHFVETYGSRIPDLLNAIKETPDGREAILPHIPHVWGELTYALRHEMTLALDDFLIRRTHLFSLDPRQAQQAHRAIVDRLGEQLGWSEEEKQQQIRRYKGKIDIIRSFRKEMA